MKKILLLVIDGLEPRFLEKWNDLPTLRRMMREGVFGRTRTPIPAMTCPAFMSFKLGKNPGKLGLYTFVKKKEGSYDVDVDVHYKEYYGEEIWEIISRHGYKVAVINVPLSYPAKKVNGIMFATLWYYNKYSCYPKGLCKELFKEIGRPAFDKLLLGFSLEEKLTSAFKLLENYHKTAMFFLKKFNANFDVIFVGLDVDGIQHEIPNLDVIHKCYRKLDNVIAEIINLVRPANVFVISDHGMDLSLGRFHINEWLRQRGYLTLKEGAGDHKKFDIRDTLTDLILKYKLHEFLLKMVPIRLLDIIYERLPSRHKEYQFMIDKIDWKRTLAFSPAVGSIFLNVKGREPNGIIEPGREYEKIRDKLISELKDLRDPITGCKLEVHVFRREELYRGEKIEEMPDIVFHIDGYNVVTSFYKTVFSRELKPNIVHSRYGTFIAYGEDIRSGVHIGEIKLEDIAPTVLFMLNIPIPEDMDGNVLKGIFKVSSLYSKRKIIYEIGEGRRRQQLIRKITSLRKRLYKGGK